MLSYHQTGPYVGSIHEPTSYFELLLFNLFYRISYIRFINFFSLRHFTTPTSSHQENSIFQSRFSRLISCVCSWVWEGRIATLHRDCSLSFYRCTPSWLAERQVTALVSWTWSILIIPCHIIG